MKFHSCFAKGSRSLTRKAVIRGERWAEITSLSAGTWKGTAPAESKSRSLRTTDVITETGVHHSW